MIFLTAHLVNLTWDLVTSNALKNAALYSETLTEFRTLYTSEVVSRLQPHGIDIAHDYKERPGSIPLPATLSIILGQSIAEHGSGGGVKLYSDYPFPWRKNQRPPLDQFEESALNYLRENPSQPYYRFVETQGVSALRYATADRMRPQCVACHNSHPDTPRKGWKTGDVRGVLSITLPIDQLFVTTQSQLWETFFLMIAVLSLTLIGLGLALRMARTRILTEEANRVKAQFLINVSHELRTPLNGVLGMAELLRQTTLDTRQFNYVKLLTDSGGHLLSVINDLLDLSKLEAEGIQLESIDFNVEDVVAEVLELLASTAAAKDLEFGYEFPDDLPLWFQGDPGRLRQILINLVNNAVKFTHQGQVSIRILKEGSGTKLQQLRFEIADTGIGIPKHKEEQLFQPFSQAEDSHSRRFGGTGLGLKISKDLVVLMGGAIGAHSIPNKGSTFWFTVPLLTSDTQYKNLPDTTPLQGRRLLLVDTDNITRKLILAYARNWGMNVQVAENERDAMDTLEASLKEKPFHFISINWNNPALPAFDLASRIRTNPYFNDIKILLLSFMNNAPAVFAIQDWEPVTVLVKPIRKTILIEHLLDLPEAESNTKTLSQPVPAQIINGMGKTILIVEDNFINQKVLCAMLERLGYTYDVVNNGLEAIDACENKDYELILMDCQMPIMDGYESSAIIRKKEGIGHRVPIIAISAHTVLEAKELATQAGMDDCISKPISLNSLNHVLRTWLEQPPSQ